MKNLNKEALKIREILYKTHSACDVEVNPLGEFISVRGYVTSVGLRKMVHYTEKNKFGCMLTSNGNLHIY